MLGARFPCGHFVLSRPTAGLANCVQCPFRGSSLVLVLVLVLVHPLVHPLLELSLPDQGEARAALQTRRDSLIK